MLPAEVEVTHLYGTPDYKGQWGGGGGGRGMLAIFVRIYFGSEYSSDQNVTVFHICSSDII